jgi:hypothetical protein
MYITSVPPWEQPMRLNEVSAERPRNCRMPASITCEHQPLSLSSSHSFGLRLDRGPQLGLLKREGVPGEWDLKDT